MVFSAAALLAGAALAVWALELEPRHARGEGFEAIAYLNGLVQLLSLPLEGVLGGRRGGLLSLGYPGPVGQATTAFVTLLVAFGTAWILGRKLLFPARGFPEDRPEGARDRASALSLGRRRFLATAGTGLLGVGGAFSFIVQPRQTTLVRRTLRLPGLPRSLEGLRAVHLSDLHMGPWISREYLRRVVEESNRLEPDLHLLTGDYVHRSSAYVAQVADILQGLRSRLGSVGVLGNHDWWEGGPQMRRALERAGVRMVDNARIFLDGRGVLDPGAPPPSAGLCLAGVGDLWEDEVLVEQALEGTPLALPRILLSHNPDVAEDPRLADPRWRVDAMLSGHTHGGQVRFPGLGAPVVPSRYGQKYAHGSVQGPHCPVHVSSGVGMTVLPIRFLVPPEIVLLELRAS